MPDKDVGRVFVIVAKTRLDLFEYFTAGFAGIDAVNVILDRRLGDAQQAAPETSAGESTSNRRAPRDIYDELESRGFVIVRLDT
jgi:hypothetical protein